MKDKKNILGINKQLSSSSTTKLAMLSIALLLAVFCTIGMSFTPAEEGENIGNPNDSTYITGPRRSHWKESGCSTTYHNTTDYAEVHAQVIVWDKDGKPITDNPSEYGSVTLSGTPIGGSATDGTTYSAKISATKPETNPINTENLNGSSVSIKWNSGEWTENSDYSGNNPIIIKNRHTLNVKVEANVAPESDYEFYGWTKVVKWDGNTTPTTKPNELYGENLNEDGLIIKESVVIGGGGDGFESYGTSENNSYLSEDSPYRVMYYAHFAPPKPQTITLKAAKNGTYTYDTDETQPETISTIDDSITTSKQITLTATPASDYKFFGWYEKDGDKEKYLSYESPWSKKFTVPTTIYAKFIPANAALFIIKDDKEKKQFWNLNEACEKALSLSLNVVLPKEDGTLYPLVDGELCTSIPKGKTATEYTIPSGVTLWIPHSDNSEPKGKNVEQVLDLDFIAANCKVYRFLTLSEGVTIIANGNIEVSAQQVSKQQSSTPKVGNNGAIYQGFGEIIMQKGSKINLQSEAYLYAWGRVTGSDESLINAYNGAVVYESFQITDYQGGSRTKAMYSDRGTYKIFPFSQYYIQNIETPLRFEFGAKEYANAILTTGALVGDGVTAAPMNELPIIGNGGSLFNINSENSYVEKRYDAVNDRQVYKIGGTTSVDNFSTSIRILMDLDIKTEDYLLPFTNNIVAHIESGELTINANLIMNADNKVTVDPKAKVIIATGKSLFVYDKDDWKTGFVFASSPNTAVAPLCYTIPYATTTGKPATVSGDKLKFTANPPIRTTVEDATLQVDGELIVDGNLYVSPGLANICSTGAGKVTFPNGNTCSETYTVHHLNAIEGNMLSAKITSTYTTLFIPAQLHNDEGKNPTYHYTQTAGSEANNTYTYDSELGRWRCLKTITWNANGGTIEPTTTIVGRGEPLSLYFPESLPIPTKTGYTFKGWFTAESSGEQITTETIVNDNVEYYAQWTLNIVGTPLDIVDADNTNQTLTINANGWASSGWPYTINGTPYEKTARQADRTLTVPYTGDTNNDMAIVVTKTGGEIVSSHIYKVPFVYTSNATLSGTDANRIVFVKSGTTLQTTDGAEAKEIYVAPGAELEVNGTLTVGKLVLRTTPWQSAVLTIENGGKIEEGGQVYYSRISPDSEQYYQFGLPLSCPLANVKMSNTDKLGGSQPKYGTAWMLKSYSESSRAEKGIREDGANWSLLPSEGTIAAGVGYEMFSNSNYYREFYFPVTLPAEPTTIVSVSYTPDGAEGAAHAGWNIITSPLTSKATVTIGDPATAIKVCWLQADGSYKQEQPTVIPPAIPFSYQASAGDKELNFSVSSTAAAPRKQSAAEALTETEWVHLDIYDTYGEGDETSLFVHPTRFEQTYKTGIDVAKQSLTAARPIIYSTHAYGDMAFAGIADSLLENGIDLVVYSPAEQKLTFSLRENKFLHRLEYLWLADNETGARTDLLMNDYTCRANAGTIKGRFVLNGRFKAPQISTGIGNTQTDYNIYAIGNNIAISGVEQGTPIYVFDAVGHMIYTTAATSDEVIVPAPCAGVYMLTIGGQTAKLVINQ